MDPISSASLIILQSAAAFLHGYIAYRFYPDRKIHWKYLSFARVMALCGLFHFTDVLFELFYLLGEMEWAGYAHLAHVGVEYALCPFMVSNLLAEYTGMPQKPSWLARQLHRLILQSQLLTRAVAVYAMASYALRLFVVLGSVPVDTLYRYPMHSGNLVISLGLLWLLVVCAGLKPEHGVLQGARAPLLWMRGLLVVFTLLAIGIDQILESLYMWEMRANVVHFVTVPFALIFAWYRYRFELVDVIFKHAVNLVVIVVVIATILRLMPLVEPNLQPLLGSSVALLAFIIVRLVGRASYRWWMPPVAVQEKFRRELSTQLGECDTPDQAMELTERKLGALFRCEVNVNCSALSGCTLGDFMPQELRANGPITADLTSAEFSWSDSLELGQDCDENPREEPARVITIVEDPQVTLDLGYIHGMRPWDSAALSLANEAALHLHNALHALHWREVQHRQKLNNQALKTLVARAERDAMRAQIRPHFFFNVLNTMHSYVQSEPDKAQRIIELLADLMRGIAQNVDQDTYPLEREIDLAHTYLKIEAMRYGERLSFSLAVDESLGDFPIPPFSIQPLVENAVKYSVDSQLQGAEISLAVQRRGDEVLIAVTDNGPGPGKAAKSNGLGIAISNIRERLDKLYMGAASLQLQPGNERGTVALLTIPWRQG